MIIKRFNEGKIKPYIPPERETPPNLDGPQKTFEEIFKGGRSASFRDSISDLFVDLDDVEINFAYAFYFNRMDSKIGTNKTFILDKDCDDNPKKAFEICISKIEPDKIIKNRNVLLGKWKTSNKKDYEIIQKGTRIEEGFPILMISSKWEGEFELICTSDVSEFDKHLNSVNNAKSKIDNRINILNGIKRACNVEGVELIRILNFPRHENSSTTFTLAFK